MARRIRSIKPEILDDEKTATLDHLSWRLFVSLWLMADNYGNLRGQPVQIKGAALWATSDTDHDVLRAIEALEVAGLVRRYTVDGQRYIHIRGWTKHQLVKSPGKPLVPGPESVNLGVDAPLAEFLRKPSADHAETLPERRESFGSSGDLDHDHDHDHERDQLPSAETAGTKSRAKRRKRPETTLPDDWRPTDDHVFRARAASLDVHREAERFRNHAVQNDRRCVDWNAAFRNWLLNAEERRRSARPQQQDLLTVQDMDDIANELRRRGM